MPLMRGVRSYIIWLLNLVCYDVNGKGLMADGTVFCILYFHDVVKLGIYLKKLVFSQKL